MFERFTERARQVVVLAQDEARALKHNYIGTEHILLGLLREEEASARVLEQLDITVEEVRAQVARIVGQGDEVTTGQIPFTPRAKKVLEPRAPRGTLARPQLHRHGAHPARPRPRERGVAHGSCSTSTRTRRRSATRSSACCPAPAAGSRARRRRGPGEKAKNLEALDQFGRNLTKQATEGKLDPVVGRQTEIERVMQILSRRQKNNPVLIGEPGVGKTAVVEGPPRASRPTRSRSS